LRSGAWHEAEAADAGAPQKNAGAAPDGEAIRRLVAQTLGT
jgi:hypothetical protein